MNKNLTICLFILDRHDFTLRFLRYYNKLKLQYPLIIGDEAGPILKKAAIFSDSTKKQLNAVLKKNRFVYRVQ